MSNSTREMKVSEVMECAEAHGMVGLPRDKDGEPIHMCDRARKAEAENAKLRELVDILCFCMQIHKRCDDCKLNGAKGELGHDPLLACDGLHEMLKELGIEVE